MKMAKKGDERGNTGREAKIKGHVMKRSVETIQWKHPKNTYMKVI